jgi:hypothetical protein
MRLDVGRLRITDGGHVDPLDRRRLGQEFVSLRHQGGGDRAREVRSRPDTMWTQGDSNP